LRNVINSQNVSESDSLITDSETGFPTLLGNLRVAAPCSADWNSMTGDDRKRFCSACNQNVYNVSSMPPSEAEAFLASKLGQKLCVRYFRRRDGTLIYRNCPIGLHQLRRQGQKVLQIVSSLIGLLVSGFASVASGEPLSKDKSPASSTQSVQNAENGQEQPPNYLHNENDIGMVDWETVKRYSQAHSFAKEQSKMNKALEKRTLELKSEHPHKTAERVALSKSYIDIANQYYFAYEYKQAAAEYRNAAKLLKNIEEEKELYHSVILSIQLCDEHMKENKRHQHKHR
jgi:hypothetical protein